MTVRHLHKQADQAPALTWASYPFPALREALVNAVYHRSYEADAVEPTKVYLFPNRVEITSYPGPVDGIERAHLVGDAPVPPVPARNRRIGELLKELRLAEARGTGLAKIRRTMRENGSPPAAFDFDAQRTYFRVTLPARPTTAEYSALMRLSHQTLREAVGDVDPAQDGSPRDAAATHAQLAALRSSRWAPAMPGVSALRDAVTRNLLDQLDSDASQQADATLGLARSKLALAAQPEIEAAVRQRLLREAAERLEGLVQREASAPMAADAWFELAGARRAMLRPMSEILAALERAVALRPTEQRFVDALAAARAATE
jgi:Putative ATP-dependent DNA helicase recG C-terminal